ncbi:hypothetical protein ACFL2D_02990 [Patescibacteria group bacterium]
MGWHECEYCEDENRKARSSGDVVLGFKSGRIWRMPDMIVHYVEAHGWVPPPEFIEDVMSGTLIASAHERPHNSVAYRHVGYLSGEFETSTAPDGFIEKLRARMCTAAATGQHRQTRSWLEPNSHLRG